MMKFILRYKFALLMAVVFGVLFIVNAAFAQKAWSVTLFSLQEMLLVIPPVFVLLGLLDVWVPRATMVRFMGEGSGLQGALLAIFIGSAAAGPLYGAFPVAAVFLKKGASIRNVFVFVGAWSTTKIPMFLFEYGALGGRFALTRLLVDIPGIIVIAAILGVFLGGKEREDLVRRASDLSKDS
jgi:uncharacterized membrane protein YraQ (UPF0718 family)